MSDCRFGVSPVNYPNPDPDRKLRKACSKFYRQHSGLMANIMLA